MYGKGRSFMILKYSYKPSVVAIGADIMVFFIAVNFLHTKVYQIF